jgi:hypothetical protein
MPCRSGLGSHQCVGGACCPHCGFAGSYCPWNTWAQGLASPIPCAAGTFRSDTSARDANECLSCPVGKYCRNGTVVPLDCPSGTNRSRTGGADDSEDCSMYACLALATHRVTRGVAQTVFAVDRVCLSSQVPQWVLLSERLSFWHALRSRQLLGTRPSGVHSMQPRLLLRQGSVKLHRMPCRIRLPAGRKRHA